MTLISDPTCVYFRCLPRMATSWPLCSFLASQFGVHQESTWLVMACFMSSITGILSSRSLSLAHFEYAKWRRSQWILFMSVNTDNCGQCFLVYHVQVEMITVNSSHGLNCGKWQTMFSGHLGKMETIAVNSSHVSKLQWQCSQVILGKWRPLQWTLVMGLSAKTWWTVFSFSSWQNREHCSEL